MPQSVSESAESVTSLDQKMLRSSPQPTLDDTLRNVPGFSLFRRSGSRIANPTSQGVSFRGIGASGASRALVLFDGIPMNDPFGGWVYWSRIPLLGVEQMEVVHGGGSSVWGNYALGGVINVITGPSRTADIELTLTRGVHGPKEVHAIFVEAPLHGGARSPA